MADKETIHIWPAQSEPTCPTCGRLAADKGEAQHGLRRRWVRRVMHCPEDHTWTIAWRANTPSPDDGRAATGGRGPDDDGPGGATAPSPGAAPHSAPGPTAPAEANPAPRSLRPSSSPAKPS